MTKTIGGGALARLGPRERHSTKPRRARRLFGWAMACAIATAALSAGLAAPADAQSFQEKIASYDVSIVIQHDGSLLINEHIVYDFGTDMRHGIIREIPDRFRYNGRYDRVYQVDFRSVRSPDAPAQYRVSNTDNAVSVRIGDPNREVSGQHTYDLTYLVRGGLNAFADHDELYWNALGNQWDVPIARAAVRVIAPAAITRATCFAGPLGSVQHCQRAAVSDRVASFTQAGLGPDQGLTVAVAIPPGVIPTPRPLLAERWSLGRAFAVTPVSAGIGAGLLVLLAVAVIVSRRPERRLTLPAAGARARPAAHAAKAADPATPAQPGPGHGLPGDLRPAQAGVLLHGVVSARDLTGTLVDLAIRGHLRIEQLERSVHQARPEWRLVRLSKTGDLLSYEQILMDGLFGGAASARTSDLGREFAATLARARDALYSDATLRGWFTDRPDRIRRGWRAFGVILTVIGAVAVGVAARRDLGLAPAPVVLAGLTLTGCARWMPRRTATGTDLARRVRRFRDSIVAPSAEHNRLTRQPGALYGYLPYAIVFGCTKQWAGLTASLAGNGHTPPWYGDDGAFSPACLASLPRSSYYFSSRFSSVSRVQNFATTAADRIGSGGWVSGGSGFSSGGGYSGGGGGGGGGGSW